MFNIRHATDRSLVASVHYSTVSMSENARCYRMPKQYSYVAQHYHAFRTETYPTHPINLPTFSVRYYIIVYFNRHRRLILSHHQLLYIKHYIVPHRALSSSLLAIYTTYSNIFYSNLEAISTTSCNCAIALLAMSNGSFVFTFPFPVGDKIDR